MEKTQQPPSPAQHGLADARARLYSAALRAQQFERLTPDQLVRVRLALKAGRSRRCSDAARLHAARHCLLLAEELEGGAG
ncbi:MAG TPA: hypothetical protein VFJ82_17220 [Longimicrobium sp.]|nr:hypothetical protein [Longimicrobium sp.]